MWDHIKNKGEHGAENYGLEFAGFWPYNCESRRSIWDYVIAEEHVRYPKLLEDAVAYGTWGIDIHTQGGILARHVEPYPPPRTDKNWEQLGALVYGIPLRSLYSRKVENLMMAGRPISCSYVAFASSRVLSTGSIVGQAVGVAASLCKNTAQCRVRSRRATRRNASRSSCVRTVTFQEWSTKTQTTWRERRK